MTMKTENAIVSFDPKALDTYGNQVLNVIVQHEEAKEDAERQMLQANEREKVIDFELTRVALHLHIEENIDLYAIYAGSKEASSKLYRSILTETGVLSRIVDEESDKVLYDFTDAALAGKFDFEASIAGYTFDAEKEKKREYTEEAVAEEKKKRSRRNALNLRLARVCKAALALFEAKATPNDMQISVDDSGALNAVISKGPSEVMGKEGTIQIHSKSVSPVEGATATPTITGLAKLSDTAHKEPAQSKDKTESADKATTAPSGNDFLALSNAMLMAVRGKEGKLSAEENTAAKNLLTELQKCVK